MAHRRWAPGRLGESEGTHQKAATGRKKKHRRKFGKKRADAAGAWCAKRVKGDGRRGAGAVQDLVRAPKK